MAASLRRSLVGSALLAVATLAAASLPAAAQTAGNWQMWLQGDFEGIGVPPSLNAAGWDALVADNVNLVRVFTKLSTNGTAYALPADAFARIDQVLAQARRRNIRVVPVFHPLPPAPDLTWFNNPQEQASLIRILQSVARRYRGNQTVAGIDILNEPYFNLSKRDLDYPGIWYDFASRIVRAMRGIDPNVIIVYEWPWYAQYPQEFRPLPFSRVVYSIHWYNPLGISHQGVNAHPLGIRYPSAADSPVGAWDKARFRREMQPVRDFQLRYPNKPIYVGEVSCNRAAPGRTAFNFVSDAVEIFEEYEWNWTYHQFRAAKEWDPELEAGSNSTVRDRNTDLMVFLRQARAEK